MINWVIWVFGKAIFKNLISNPVGTTVWAIFIGDYVLRCFFMVSNWKTDAKILCYLPNFFGCTMDKMSVRQVCLILILIFLECIVDMIVMPAGSFLALFSLLGLGLYLTVIVLKMLLRQMIDVPILSAFTWLFGLEPIPRQPLNPNPGYDSPSED